MDAKQPSCPTSHVLRTRQVCYGCRCVAKDEYCVSLRISTALLVNDAFGLHNCGLVGSPRLLGMLLMPNWTGPPLSIPCIQHARWYHPVGTRLQCRESYTGWGGLFASTAHAQDAVTLRHVI